VHEFGGAVGDIEVGLEEGDDVGDTTGELLGLEVIGLLDGRGDVSDPFPCKLEYPLTGLLDTGGLVGLSVGFKVGTAPGTNPVRLLLLSPPYTSCGGLFNDQTVTPIRVHIKATQMTPAPTF
jgi:hypothetical protein